MEPASIVITGTLEVGGDEEIKLPGTVRDIAESEAPSSELEGGNDTGRSSKVCSVYRNNDVTARDC